MDMIITIISYIGWVAFWISTTILSAIFGAWMIAKTYPVDKHEYIDLFFDEKLWSRNRSAIIFISIVCWIPFVNLFIGLISFLGGCISDDFNFKPLTGTWNPMLRLMRRLLKTEYLLDRVSKEI